jgi:hypothetical protein
VSGGPFESTEHEAPPIHFSSSSLFNLSLGNGEVSRFFLKGCFGLEWGILSIFGNKIQHNIVETIIREN